MTTLESFQSLLKEFFNAYIYNLNKDYKISKTQNVRNNNNNNNNNNKNKNIRDVSPGMKNFYSNLDLICSLFGNDSSSDSKYEELFKTLIENMIKFNTLYKTLPFDMKNISLIDMHGEFPFIGSDGNINKNILKTIPDNVVLVFITPINRVGFGNYCSIISSKKYVKELKQRYKDENIRKQIFEDLSCLDKHNYYNSFTPLDI
jgi:hypothetical protein